MTVAVETYGLSKRFPRSSGYLELLPGFIRKTQWIKAVDGVSLSIEDGELLGLLGPNGAGKTTLMKMLCTLILPTSGRASCYGYDVVKDEQHVKEIVGFIGAEERSFYWRLTGRENLEFYASLYHMPKRRQRIDELLTLVGLTEQANRRFHTYSTGMRQRLAIARGLLNNPRLLFIDEPTKGLDSLAAQGIRQFLREEVAQAGRTVVLATHNITEAQQLCHRLAILNSGRVIAVGSIAELRRIFQRHDRCQLQVRNFSDGLPAKLGVIPGVASCGQPYQHNGSTTMEMILSDRRLALPEVMRSIVDEGGDVCDCSITEATLEEILRAALEANEGAS